MAAFVGREAELARLEQRLSQATSGKGRVVFVTGDAGAGKSTLVAAFLAAATQRVPELRIVRASCSEQYGAGEPYQPFVDAFRDLLRAEAEQGGRRSLREVARDIAPYWLAAIPVAGDIIAATVATASELRSSFGSGAAEAPSEEALFFQYTELFLAAAQREPLLLFLDDLHWADRATVTLLTHLARKIEEQQVLILGTYRAADVAESAHPIRDARLELERYHLAEELALPSLEASALEQLTRAELGGPVAPSLVQWLTVRAGTNPLYFTELLRWLVEQGVAREVNGEWRLERVPEEIDVPRSAASTIEKRLSRLDPDRYRIVEYASVEGDEFDSTALALLLDMDELALEDALDPLVRVHRLIRLKETRDLPSGEPTSVYEFSHSLIQDVLHAQLQGKRRILLHRKMAQILEQQYAADTRSISHRLSVHFDEGRMPERAFDFAIMAADRASRVYAHLDALELCQRALRNATDSSKKAEVLDRLGDLNWRVGRYPDALDAYGQAVVEATSAELLQRVLALRRKSIMVERDQGSRSADELLRLMSEVQSQAEALGAREERCYALWNRIDLPGTDDDEDVRLATEALAIAQEMGEAGLVARGHYFLGLAQRNVGALDEAADHFEKALEIYQESGDLSRGGRCYNALAVTRIIAGDYAGASAAFDGARAAFDKVGNPTEAASVRTNLGVLLARTGDWERAEESLREAVRLFRSTGAQARVFPALQSLAELQQFKDDWDAAAATWRELQKVGAETGFWNAEVIAQCGLGMVHLQRGELDVARELETVVRERLLKEEAWSDAREAYQLFLARLSARAGDIEAADALLSVAEKELAARDRFMWGMARLEHAEVLDRLGAEGAAAAAQEALDAFDALGARPMRQKATELLGALKSGT
jgi:tetratricopeptide (TPR) repeat protein